MPQRHVTLDPQDAQTDTSTGVALRQRFSQIRDELEVIAAFPVEVLAEVEKALVQPVDPPTADETGTPYVTLDPPGSMDLDQAMHLEREGDGYRVRYAIADLTPYVAPGGALDACVRSRGQTIYCPDTRVPLHPSTLSEGAASLLPGQVRAAYVWDLRLDAEGQMRERSVRRAMVRSVERLDYASVQEQIDQGTTDERLALLREVGERRIAQEQARGGASLPMPEQEVHEESDGTFRLTFRPPRMSEEWNAQISLLTGMAAADLMIEAGVGVLRTMPPPDQDRIDRFRRQARALGAPWPAEQRYGDFIRGLDRTNSHHLALIHEATALFRGAGYAAFDGAPPEQREHAAIAASYAHVTAPLRRLVDRFGLFVCEAVAQGREVPAWVREALPTLPDLMTASDRQARAVDRASLDAVEAAALTARVGEVFDAVVVDASDKGLEVQLTDLPVLADTQGRAELAAHVRVRLVSARVESGTVDFEVVR